ncbi:MAG: META domain-containing protein [Enterobacterales bacterium]|nr:META domain-containing protein [Enterobacterales bacterium]
MRLRQFPYLVLVIGSLLILSACQTKTMHVPTEQLEQYIWQLQSLDGQKTIPGTTVSLMIRGEKITGTGGANRYFAGWVYADSKLTISPIGATKRMMIEPNGVMQQEQRYFELLQAAVSVEIEGQLLILINSDGQRLVFIPQPEL